MLLGGRCVDPSNSFLVISSLLESSCGYSVCIILGSVADMLYRKCNTANTFSKLVQTVNCEYDFFINSDL